MQQVLSNESRHRCGGDRGPARTPTGHIGPPSIQSSQTTYALSHTPMIGNYILIHILIPQMQISSSTLSTILVDHSLYYLSSSSTGLTIYIHTSPTLTIIYI